MSDTISHPDDRDMTCASSSHRKLAAAYSTTALARFAPSSPLSGLRIGLPIQTHLPEPYVQLSRSLLSHLKSLGATLVPVDLPSARLALPAYYVLASAEASSNLARYGGGWYGNTWEREAKEESGEERRRRIRTDGFGREVRKRILAGTHALSAKYVGAGQTGTGLTVQCVQQHVPQSHASEAGTKARLCEDVQDTPPLFG